MKKTLLLFTAATALLFNSCKIEKNEDLGPETTRTINVRAFNQLVISNSNDVEFIPSDTFSVTITAPEKSIGRTTLSVSDSVLTIGHRSGNSHNDKDVIWIANNDNYYVSKLVVRAPYLTLVSLAGSGSLACSKVIKTPELTLQVAGSGDINLAGIEAGTVEAVVAGSGTITARLSRVASTTANVRGSGDIAMKLAECGGVTAGVSGSGEVSLSGSARTLSQDVAGSGNIDTDNLKLTK